MPSRAAIKASGVHYTPPELARFLARLALEHTKRGAPLRVLDPACGDGRLLHALALELGDAARADLTLVGLDRDAAAVSTARTSLEPLRCARLSLHVADFLDARDLARNGPRPATDGFDLVIANPPYVRTQVLGARRSRALARSHDLSGRVDLYHAFIHAMTRVLAPGGTLGLLCSNRFLFTRSGAAVRELLSEELAVERILDLGDTRLFGAAVLPAIVIATRRAPSVGAEPRFTRVYEVRDASETRSVRSESILGALDTDRVGAIETPGGRYRIEEGVLERSVPTSPWRLVTTASRAWLARVEGHAFARFGDVARIRVGIKTTADSVFIRDDWQTLEARMRPEPELLRPLLTHREAARWRARPGPSTKHVLYPHATVDGRRVALDLAPYPRARRYLESHREALEARRYVIESGREWYELWVPQDPSAWAQRKLVSPDISESPRFFLDDSGAVVNGDCYWMTLRPGVSPDLLLLLLAVAGSSLAVRFYDEVCGNRLYAGRRRFITQYVERFPIPEPEHEDTRRAIALTRERLADPAPTPAGCAELDAEIDRAILRAFGL